jgi:hypothetical protein
VTTYQILSLCALAIALAGVYGSSLIGKVKWGSVKPNTILSSIEAVVAVRERYQDEAVRAACNALLSALLKVQG